MQNKNELSLFESMVVGIFFSFLISWTQSSNALPLINFFPDFFLTIALPILSLATIVLIYFQKKYLKSFFIIAFTSLLIVTLYRYSSGYAFRSFVLFVLLFPLVFSRNDKREMQIGSTLIVSLLFIFAGIQKMNAAYLGGAEFISGSPFMSFMDLWFPGKIPTSMNPNFLWLPHFSAIMELVIGAGIFFRPKLFSHVAAFFMLLMSFINPPVLNVYFFLLPFLFLADENISDFLERLSIRNFLNTPFFWTFLIYILTPSFRTFEAALGRSYLFVAIIIGVHIGILISSKKRGENKAIVLNEILKMRILVIPALMFIFFIGSYFVLPSPFGFKMFSGQKFKLSYYDLKMSNPEACSESLRRWTFVPVTDAALVREGESCHLYFPTMGGIEYATQYLCKLNSDQSFTIKKSDEASETPLNCPVLAWH